MNTSLYTQSFEAPLVSRSLPPDGEFSAFHDAVRPELGTAFIDLFHAIDALRVDDRPLVVQFAGCDPSCPTDRVTSGLARAAADATDRRVLYIDATGGPLLAGPDVLAAFREGRSPAETALPTRDRRIAWAGFGRSPLPAGAEAARLLDAAREAFAITVLDTGPVDGGRGRALARHCDGIVLVAGADRTRCASIAAARTLVERAGGRLLGAVMTGGAVEMPRWLASRL